MRHPHTFLTARVLAIAICVSVLATRPALAEDDGGKITVFATGNASSPPDRIEMAVTVVGSAQLAGEATVKYRGQRERLLEALKSLGIDNLKTRPGPMAVTSAGAMQRNQYGQMVPAANGAEFTLTETVVIDFPAGENTLDTVAKIFDVGKDLGVTFITPQGKPSGSLAEPRFLKVEEAEQAAYKDALEDARKKAELLAKLAGKSLGEISSIDVTKQSIQQAPSSSDRMMTAWLQAVGMEAGIDTATAEGVSLTRQQTSVQLRVEFELQ